LQGEVYFGSGPDCQGLVEVATRDLHPGTIHHTVVVTGNDLRETVGDNGIIPGATYFFEVITLAASGASLALSVGADQPLLADVVARTATTGTGGAPGTRGPLSTP
jgi:hypothetical protein